MIQFISEDLKKRLLSLPVVDSISETPGVNRNQYYGMNVSPSSNLEPVDQLDGFLVARLMQNEIGGEFYPFVAGAYEVGNLVVIQVGEQHGSVYLPFQG